MIETRNSSIVPTVSRLAVYNNSFWFVVTSLIWNRSPRSSFLHDPQCVTFPHEKSQSICVSVVAALFLGRANNLWILQVPRNVFCPLDRSVSHSLRAGQSTVIFLLILFHSLLQKQQKMLYSLFQSKLDAENVWIFSPFIQIIVSRFRNGDV